MKILTTVLLLSISLGLTAQDKIVGCYKDNFGSRVQLNADYTFEYTWQFDMSSSWTSGTWTLSKDTIYFHMIPIYDTVSNIDSNNLTVNTLILSNNKVPERIDLLQSAIIRLSGGGQNRMAYPDKLVMKKGKLYNINKGKLVVKKQKGWMWSKEKYDPWYFRCNE